MMNIQVKKEKVINNGADRNRKPPPPPPESLIDLGSSSDSESESESDLGNSSDDDNNINTNNNSNGLRKKKKRRLNSSSSVVLPLGFLDPLPRGKDNESPLPLAVKEPFSSPLPLSLPAANGGDSGKQFWKAGDYEGVSCGDWNLSSGGMDHVRVHPKFLHSNATSHKWVLGAFAELLDNSLDEVCNGATFVNIDMIESKKDGSRMLLIEDNGGGMDPDKMRQCMSLGYSVKSKLANTIGQYGNGFKTSTMRLGADVIVFSRCCGKDGNRPTQSIGLLSYTFLKSTGKEDIVVPMLDYEKRGQRWNKIIRSSDIDWHRNVETIVRWSPFASEEELLSQFNQIKDRGTRIIIYNLWEDDQGSLELDFDTDPHDIQIRGVNRDEKNIQMAQQYPNSRHFLTYRHSLRSYASILYLRIPPGFRIILRGEDVEHHNVVNDMMMSQEITYRPQPGDGIPKDTNIRAVVTVGFVKDAKAHIDVQGFNVYHKNRLIKPFWRLWHAPGSDGRGVIGVLEANFVEPAHDKQGFERTLVLSRLEARLVQMQKNYWSTNCHKIGYAPRRNKKSINDRDDSPDPPSLPSQSKTKSAPSSGKAGAVDKKSRSSSNTILEKNNGFGQLSNKRDLRTRASSKRVSSPEPSSSSAEDMGDDDVQTVTPKNQESRTPSRKLVGKGGQLVGSPLGSKRVEAEENFSLGRRTTRSSPNTNYKESDANQCDVLPSNRNENGASLLDSEAPPVDQLKEENRKLRERLRKKEEEMLGDLIHDLQCERDRCKSLEAQLSEAKQKIEELNKEQESLIDIFSEERQRRDAEEENLRKKLKDASNTIQGLLDKVKALEKMKSANVK